MALMLTCDCTSRYIRHEKTGSSCSACGSPAVEAPSRAVSRRQLDVDYECPISGKPIRSKRAHEENLRATGYHVLESGEKEEAIARRAKANKDFDAAIERTAEELLHNLPTEKKQQLATEMKTLPTCEYMRTTE